jgi:hypothetical protein
MIFIDILSIIQYIYDLIYLEKSIIMELSNLSADAGTLLKQTLREDLLFGNDFLIVL